MAELESRLSSASGSPERGSEEVSMSVRPMPAKRLYRAADLSALSFASTADIEPADGLVGQQRALGAIAFGTPISTPGFNL